MSWRKQGGRKSPQCQLVKRLPYHNWTLPYVALTLDVVGVRWLPRGTRPRIATNGECENACELAKLDCRVISRQPCCAVRLQSCCCAKRLAVGSGCSSALWISVPGPSVVRYGLAHPKLLLGAEPEERIVR